MLLELVIENYAVVDRLRVRFHPGLNLLTGETGSGKSIVVDALGLLLGGKGSADLIRSGADRAIVSGEFSVRRSASIKAQLDELGLELEDDAILIEDMGNQRIRVLADTTVATRGPISADSSELAGARPLSVSSCLSGPVCQSSFELTIAPA